MGSRPLGPTKATSLVAITRPGAKPAIVYVCGPHRERFHAAGYQNASRTNTDQVACGLCAGEWLAAQELRDPGQVAAPQESEHASAPQGAGGS